MNYHITSLLDTSGLQNMTALTSGLLRASGRVHIPLWLCLLSLTACHIPTFKRSDGIKPIFTQAERSVTMKATYTIESQVDTQKFRFVVLLPGQFDATGKNEPKWQHRQFVTGRRFSLPPSRQFVVDGRQYAEFMIENPKSEMALTVETDLILKDYDLMMARGLAKGLKTRTPGPLPVHKMNRYLAIEPGLNFKHPKVVELATIEAGDELTRIRNLFDVTLMQLEYGGYSDEAKGAVKTILDGRGDCTDYSDVLVALARANAIPARHIRGFSTLETGDTPKHSWVEIYTRSYGWIPFDPLKVDQEKATFDDLPIIYISLSDVRKDPNLNDDYQYWIIEHWGAPVTIFDTYSFTSSQTYAFSE